MWRPFGWKVVGLVLTDVFDDDHDDGDDGNDCNDGDAARHHAGDDGDDDSSDDDDDDDKEESAIWMKVVGRVLSSKSHPDA